MRSVHALAIVMLAACGRIGFDPLETPTVMVAVGGDVTCSLVAGDVACWGQNDLAQLGRGTVTPEGPIEYVAGLPPVEYLATSSNSGFAIDTSGVIWSWGHTGSHALGVVEAGPRVTPARSPQLADVVEIVGGTGICARTRSDTVTCWGDGDGGQLAIGGVVDQTLPTMSVLSPPVSQLAMGSDHACGVVQGELYCWGVNELGQLGIAVSLSTDSCENVLNNFVPCSIAPVPLGIAGPLAIAAGRSHSCAIFADQRVRCWGGNAVGALGDGSNTDSIAPVMPLGLGTATAVVASRDHSCALVSDGSAWCWGLGTSGELGDGNLATSNVPVRVAVPTALRTIVTEQSAHHTCAIDVNDDIWCWGGNLHGQLGELGRPDGGPYRVVLPARDGG